MWRAVVLCAACAIVLRASARPAPPAKKSDDNESKMLPEEQITIRRLPSSYSYPFSLWPVPKYRAPDPRQQVSKRLNSLGSFKNLRFGFNRR